MIGTISKSINYNFQFRSRKIPCTGAIYRCHIGDLSIQVYIQDSSLSQYHSYRPDNSEDTLQNNYPRSSLKGSLWNEQNVYSKTQTFYLKFSL